MSVCLSYCVRESPVNLRGKAVIIGEGGQTMKRGMHCWGVEVGYRMMECRQEQQRLKDARPEEPKPTRLGHSTSPIASHYVSGEFT